MNVLTENNDISNDNIQADNDNAEFDRYIKSSYNRGAAFTLRTSDDDDSHKPKTSQTEYRSRDDEFSVRQQILSLKTKLTVRCAVLLFASIFSLFITIANDFSLPLSAVFDISVNPAAFLFTNTILAIIAVGFSYSLVSLGIKNLLHGSPDSDSVVSINLLFSIAAGLATLFEPESLKASYFHLYTAAAITGLFFNTLGKLSVVNRTLRNFDFTVNTQQFTAVQNIENDNTAAYLTNGSAGSVKELAMLRRTDFIRDFMKNSYSSDLADLFAEKSAWLMVLISVTVGILSLMFEENAVETYDKVSVFLASMSGTFALCSSFSLTLIANLPLSKASQKALDHQGLLLGYSSVEEFAEVGSILIDAEHLFPASSVEFVNLKVLGGTPIDKSLIYSASLAESGKLVTRHAFLRILRDQPDMLMDVKNCISEEGLGISGDIDGMHMILGSRDLLEKQHITGLPTIDTEEDFAGENQVLYLAVSGQAAMMIAVKLNPDRNTVRQLRALEREYVDFHVRSADGFITRELIGQLFGLDPSNIHLLSSSLDKDYSELTAPAASLSASMYCTGHLKSFAYLLVAAKKVKFSANVGVAVQYGSMLLGAAMAICLMLMGAFSQITPTIVIVYNFAFTVITLILENIRKI